MERCSLPWQKRSSFHHHQTKFAAFRAITLAMDLNLPSFIVEGDSKVVISALRNKEESFSSFGHLISSIKHYLVYCNCISFSHTRRSGNSVTYFLAKFAKTIDCFSIWMEDVPPQVSDVLLADFGWFQYLYDEDGFSKKEKKRKEW